MHIDRRIYDKVMNLCYVYMYACTYACMYLRIYRQRDITPKLC